MEKFLNGKLKGQHLVEFLSDFRAYKDDFVPNFLSNNEFNYVIAQFLSQNFLDKQFERAWTERFKIKGGKGSFQTSKEESAFSEYSSKGWKIHIAFLKGKEKEVAKFLFEHELYFKVESGIGTYFNGNESSGATIYIGSYDHMISIAYLISHAIGSILVQGAYVIVNGRKLSKGSGSDIEILPNITARFDVAKTKFGWYLGNKKYSEYGMPTWTGFGGIAILKSYEKIISVYEGQWNKVIQEQRNNFMKFFKSAYEASKRELIKDFGEEFVFGKK